MRKRVEKLRDFLSGKALPYHSGKWLQQSVPYTLMITFGLIMHNIFSERPAKGFLAEKNHAIQAFLFYRTYKSFCECITVGCPGPPNLSVHRPDNNILN